MYFTEKINLNLIKTAHLNPYKTKSQLNFITQLALSSFTGNP
jgi:hypothetical protein